jgi:hypothetical protein
MFMIYGRNKFRTPHSILHTRCHAAGILLFYMKQKKMLQQKFYWFEGHPSVPHFLKISQLVRKFKLRETWTYTHSQHDNLMSLLSSRKTRTAQAETNSRSKALICTEARTWSGGKITGLILLPTPCGLANSERGGILACPLPSINPTTSKALGQKCGSSLCLKWAVYVSSVGFMLSDTAEQRVNVKLRAELGNPL